MNTQGKTYLEREYPNRQTISALANSTIDHIINQLCETCVALSSRKKPTAKQANMLLGKLEAYRELLWKFGFTLLETDRIQVRDLTTEDIDRLTSFTLGYK